MAYYCGYEWLTVNLCRSVKLKSILDCLLLWATLFYCVPFCKDYGLRFFSFDATIHALLII